MEDLKLRYIYINITQKYVNIIRASITCLYAHEKFLLTVLLERSTEVDSLQVSTLQTVIII